MGTLGQRELSWTVGKAGFITNVRELFAFPPSAKETIHCVMRSVVHDGKGSVLRCATIAQGGILSKFGDRKSLYNTGRLNNIMIELTDRLSEIQRSNMVDSERKSYFWSERRRFLGVPSLRIGF